MEGESKNKAAEFLISKEFPSLGGGRWNAGT